MKFISRRGKEKKTKDSLISSKLRESLEKTNIKISCVIPAYNEAERILFVLEAIKNYDLFDEVVIVNDGSTDNTAKVVEDFIVAQHTRISWNFINNPINQGKTKAVIDAVNVAEGNIIILLDADLKGLSHLHLDKLIYYLVVQDYSLTILDRHTDRRGPLGWITFTRFLGGERGIWKKDFLKLDLPTDRKKGYLLEAIMNKYMMDNGKSAITIFCYDLFTTHQTTKNGFWKGFISYSEMTYRILTYLKLKDTYKHFIYIDEDRIINLYDLNRKMRRKASFLVVGGAIAAGFGLFLVLNAKRYDTDKNLKKLYKINK